LRAGSGVFDVTAPGGKTLLMKLLVKCATTAPVARAVDVSLPWASFLVEDVLPKGPISEEESPGSDAKRIANAMITYLTDFCLPMYTILGRIVPPMQAIGERVRINVAVWRAFVQ
jgi:hypothetical protein